MRASTYYNQEQQMKELEYKQVKVAPFYHILTQMYIYSIPKIMICNDGKIFKIMEGE